MNFGEKIYECRKKQNLSQEELAEILGVSRQALSKWECGTSMPDVENIIALSNYFQVPTDYLLKDEAIIPIKETLENQPREPKLQFNENVIITIATVIIAVGLFIALGMMNDGSQYAYWRFPQAVLGICLQILGVGLFQVLYFTGQTNSKNQYKFWQINTWLVSVLPIFFTMIVALRWRPGFISFHFLFAFVIVYIIFNLLVELIIKRLINKQ